MPSVSRQPEDGLAPAPRVLVTPERERDIIAQAEGLAICTFGLGRVEPEQLITAAGLTMSRGSYGQAFDGLLEYDGKGFHVYANADRLIRFDEGRGAFTLGHELGHYHIYEHRRWMEENPGKKHPSFLFSSLAKDAPHEREADLFSSNLIIPAPSFKKRVGCPTPSADLLRDTAGFFGCSLTSTAIRFCELEPFPCAIIRWDETGKYLWGRMSPKVRATYGKMASDLTGDRAQSLTADAIRQGLGRGAPDRRVTVSEVWFPWAEDRVAWKGLEQCSAQIYEHIIPLGSYGFLTLLAGHEWMKLVRSN